MQTDSSAGLERQLQGERDRAQQLQSECDRLRQTVKNLEEERQRLQESLAKVQAERDIYLRTVYAYLKEEITEEQLEAWFSEPPVEADLLQIIDQLEKEAGKPA